MSTSLNLHTSAGFQNQLKKKGVHAYYFLTGNSTGTGTLTEFTDDHKIPLEQPMSSGKCYILLQAPGSENNTPPLSEVITQESDINWDSAAKYGYRYDSMEFTLSGSATDVANLTSINMFGFAMDLSVPYSDGSSAHAGYKPASTGSGKNILQHIKAENFGDSIFTFPNGSALENSCRAVLTPTTECGWSRSPSPNPYAPQEPIYAEAQWHAYIHFLKQDLIKHPVILSGLFVGTKDATGNTYPKQFYHYKIAYAEPCADSSLPFNDGMFVCVPQSNSMMQQIITISPTELAKSIYSTLGDCYVGADLTTAKKENTGSNTPAGYVMSQFLTGFTAGYFGCTGMSLSPDKENIDLNQNINWDPSFAFQNNIAEDRKSYAKSPKKNKYDPYTEIFFNNSNSYGNSYTDTLMQAYAKGGPQIPVWDTKKNADVSDIDLTIYADDENTAGYTPPVIYDRLPANADKIYAAPDPASCTLGLIAALAFQTSVGTDIVTLGKNASVTLSILKSYDKNTPQWDTLTIPNTTSIYGTWPIQHGASGYNFGPNPVPPGTPTNGTITLTNIPTAPGQTCWYKLTLGSGKATKTFNFYIAADADGHFKTGAGHIAVDGLAHINLPVPPSLQNTNFTIFFGFAAPAELMVCCPK